MNDAASSLTIEALRMEEPEDDFGDLVLADESSLDFWDNPADDEVWNSA